MWAPLTSWRSRCGPFDDVGQPTLLKSVCVNRANMIILHVDFIT